MRGKLLDLYAKLLLANLGNINATVLSQALDGEVSHDAISRYLRESIYTSRDLWKFIKPLIKKIETLDGVIALDDFISNRPYMSENSVVNMHYDHAKNRMVRGIGILDATYKSHLGVCPLDFRIITKCEEEFHHEKQRFIRFQDQDKNTIFREILLSIQANNIKYKFVVADKWYASAENMKFIRNDLHKHFVMPLKSNRNVKLMDDPSSDYVAISEIPLEPMKLYRARLKKLAMQVWVMKWTGRAACRSVQDRWSSKTKARTMACYFW
jgi:hypothetical protein